MTGWRGPWKHAGLLGVAIALAAGLAACGTASGKSVDASSGPTTAPAPSSGGSHAKSMTGGTASSRVTGSSRATGSSKATGGSQAARPRPRQPKPPATARIGDHGKGVAALQRRLAALGYEVSKADGQFGPSTQHAVTAFQKVNRLDRDGVAGPKTMKALAHPRRPHPRLGGRALHLEADLTLQVVYVVRNGKIQQVLDASSASGRSYVSQGEVRIAHTPEGSFNIGRKINGWHRSSLGLLYRPAYFDGPYALHGAPSVPPFPASHGCIRITTTAMDALYGKLVPGTRVLVYRS
ncbi:MAG TPA: L,D-transpeptidase family protein [Actinomycetota bacterium]